MESAISLVSASAAINAKPIARIDEPIMSTVILAIPFRATPRIKMIDSDPKQTVAEMKNVRSDLWIGRKEFARENELPSWRLS